MICIKEYELPPVDLVEALRYMGVHGESSAPERELLVRAGGELSGRLTPRACFAVLPVHIDGDAVDIGGRKCRSHSLAARLVGARLVVVFAATVGAEPDRLIRKYERTSPAAALAVSALGTERVEALCDLLCADLCRDFGGSGYKTVTRFSPGYGDLSLDFQRDVFALLSPERRIGVSLGDSLLMSPSKSVTAIVGLITTDDEGKDEI